MKLITALIVSLFLVSCATKPAKKEAEATAKDAATKTEAAAKDATQEVEKKAEEAVAKPAEATAKAATPGAVTCMYQQEKRVLAVNQTEAGGCELNYEKNGVASVVATARSGVEHCQGVSDRIKNNLEGAGFKCE